MEFWETTKADALLLKSLDGLLDSVFSLGSYSREVSPKISFKGYILADNKVNSPIE